MASQWAPAEDVLGRILNVLRDVRGGVADQAAAIAELEALRAHPEYALYMVYIITQLPGVQPSERLQASSQLQDYVARFPVTADTLGFMKAQLTSVLGVVASIGPIFARIAVAERLAGWGPILAHMHGLLSEPAPYTALKNLWYLLEDISCEDNADDMVTALESPALGEPLRHLVPKLISLVAGTEPAAEAGLPAVRVLALRTLLLLLDLEMPSVDANVEGLLLATFQLADQVHTPEAGHYVTQALSSLASLRLAVIIPYISQVAEFMMLNMGEDAEERTRIGACDFWFELVGGADYVNGDLEEGDCDLRRGLFAPFLASVLPKLISNIVYDEDELAELAPKLRNDALEADDAQDIKPHHYNGGGDDDGFGDDDEDEDGNGGGGGGDDDGDDSPEARWTVRKTSGRAIDILASIYPEEVMEVATPLLAQGMHSEDWRVVEASLLVFGAIAAGCHEYVAPTLPENGMFIISLMAHERVLVRSTACWTVSRYAAYLVNDEALFLALLTSVCERIQDGNKMVQHSACSVLATVLDHARGARLAPYAARLIDVMGKCVAHYQTRNKSMMFDAFDSLAKACDAATLTAPDVLPPLMAVVLGSWAGMASDDYCVVDVAVFTITVLNKLGARAEEYAGELAPALVTATSQCYTRITELRRAYELEGTSYSLVNDDEADVNRVSALVDAISALTSAIAGSAAALWEGSGLIDMLRAVLSDPQLSIRISAHGLLGDVATNCGAEEVLPFLGESMPRVVENVSLDPARTLLANNAAWVVYCAARRFGADVFAPDLVEKALVPRLCGLIVQPEVEGEFGPQVTAASALCRIGALFPAQVAAKLPHIFAQWSLLVPRAPDVDSLLRGYCAVIGLAPEHVAQPAEFVSLLRVLYAVLEVAPSTAELAAEVLGAFKGMMGPQGWAAAWAGVPEAVHALIPRLGLQ
jgi:transportin-1